MNGWVLILSDKVLGPMFALCKAISADEIYVLSN